MSHMAHLLFECTEHTVRMHGLFFHGVIAV